MTNSGADRTASIGLVTGVVLFCGVMFMPLPDGMTVEARRLLAATALMSSWWLTQAIPIGVTSLIPIVAFPLLGIQGPDLVSKAYINKLTFLFLGGFIIALGIERWGLHQRIALHIVRILGTSLRRVILGFMIATAFLSMWISNTASTLLMTPIAVALVLSLQDAVGGHSDSSSRESSQSRTVDRDGPVGPFGISLMLGIAWSASIGGLTTLVGTITNVQFVGLWEGRFPDGPQISAGGWLAAFAPVGIVMILVTWGILVFRMPTPGSGTVDREFFGKRLRALGPPSRSEWLMFGVFVATALLWTFRKPLIFGETTLIEGWGTLAQWFLTDVLHAESDFARKAVHDSTVAIAMSIVMFILPGERREDGVAQRLMDWETAVRLPWAILLLVGGGFAIASAFDQTGLAEWVGDAFAEGVHGWPIWAVIAAVCCMLTFLTEFATNVVVVSVILPVLAEASLRLNIDPRLLMLPAAASASCAFMLPIGTPPNAIVFSSGLLSMGDMARKGFVLNLIGIMLMTLATVLYLVPHLGLSTEGIPDWAAP